MRYQYTWVDVDYNAIPLDWVARAEETIMTSLQLGINHFETARAYGTSEAQLGRILSAEPRDTFMVQTKIKPNADPKRFLADFNESLTHLGLEYVDMLSFHGINNAELADWTQRKGGCLDVARMLQKEERVRFVGFSTHAPCSTIVQIIRRGEMDYVNLHWYFVNELAWPAIIAAAEQDMGVLIISPTDKGGRLYSPPAKLTCLCEPLHPIQFNDLYCLRRPEVHTLSVGARQPSDFDLHVAAVDNFAEITPILSQIEDRVREAIVEVWGSEWAGRWFEGIPEHEHIPGQVNVLEILRLWTYAKPLDLLEWARKRYNLFQAGSHWFPGNGAQDIDEGLLLSVLKDSPFAYQIPDTLREAHAALTGPKEQRLSLGGAR